MIPSNYSQGPSVPDAIDVFARHDIIYQSPLVSDPKKAKYVVLLEDHLNQCSWFDNALVIDHLVEKDSLALCEGVIALKEVSSEDRNVIFQTLKISKWAQKSLTLAGWDYLNHLSSDNKEILTCQMHPDGTASLVRVKENVLPFGDRLADFLEESRAFDLIDAQYKTRDISSDARGKIEEIRAMLRIRRALLDVEVAQTFPTRTRYMCYTLQKIDQDVQKGFFKGRIFLFCGVYHAKQRKTDDHRFSLAPLYEELEKIAAIVLYPKVIANSC